MLCKKRAEIKHSDWLKKSRDMDYAIRTLYFGMHCYATVKFVFYTRGRFGKKCFVKFQLLQPPPRRFRLPAASGRNTFTFKTLFYFFIKLFDFLRNCYD